MTRYVFLFVAAAACASSSSSVPGRGRAPAAAVRQTCPDSSDGSSIVVDAVETAHRAIAANPATTPPPVCLVAAVAQLQTPIADSTREHALAVAAAIGRGGNVHAELLASEMMLLSGLKRYAEVSRTYDRLLAVDTAPSMDVVRVALGAAHARADTATLTRIVASAAARAGAPPAFRTESEVIRNVRRLWTAVNQAGDILRQYPRTVNQYPSIVANFATLALPDSVAVYARRGVANGATRADLTPSIESFVSTMQRHAWLYGSAYQWEQALAGAVRVDSALSIPSTKFLVASFAVQFAGPMVFDASADVDSKDATRRADACQRLARASSTLDAAGTNLRAAGNRPSANAVSSLGDALNALRGKIALLREGCGTDRKSSSAR